MAINKTDFNPLKNKPNESPVANQLKDTTDLTSGKTSIANLPNYDNSQKSEWKNVEPTQKKTHYEIRDASDGINRCKTEIGIPLEILREYDFSYQTNRLFIAFIVFPKSLKDFAQTFPELDSARLFHSYFPYHVTEVKLSGIGSVTPTTLSEESFLTVLPKYQKITEISTTIPSFYYKGLSDAHIGLFLQKWMGILGWKSSPYNYMGYLKQAYEMNKSNLTTSLYKGNILVCSFKQTTVKAVEESQVDKVIGYRDIYEAEQEKTKVTKATNYEDGSVGYTTETKRVYKHARTENITEKYKFSYAPYTLEEVFLCLGVFPKSISGIGDYNRDYNGYRQYDISWNVDLILTNQEIYTQAQNMVNDYLKQLFNVKKFDEYSTYYDGSDKSGTRYQAPKPPSHFTETVKKTEVMDKDGNVVSGSSSKFSEGDARSQEKAQDTKSASTWDNFKSKIGGMFGGNK